jgi:HSP20 family protein
MAAPIRGRDWTRDLADWFPRFFEAPETWFAGERSIHVEEYVDQGHLVVKAEIPGVDPDKDVEITVRDGILEIKTERRQETKVEEKDRFRSEFRYGSFSRTLPLPSGAREDDVQAQYRDGILEVRVPLGEATAESRKIPINRS